MLKTTAYVMLISLVIGVLLQILFPEILLMELKNNIYNLQNNSEIKGNIFAVGFGFPIIISVITGLTSETLIRSLKNYRRK